MPATDISVEDKLRALYDLQIIDRRIDEIRALRGELPLEVEDLENEVAGLETRMEKVNHEIADLQVDINEKQLLIKECNDKIAKYQKDQEQVRNNREFEAIAKEIEYQELEIQLAEKRIREFSAQIDAKQEINAKSQERLEERKNHLGHKQAELDGILQETQREEQLLEQKSIDTKALIEPRLVAAYDRIRNNTKNGLAVVSIERGASAGSYFVIPPQRQMELAQRKKIMIDEHSGRILVDPMLAAEQEEKMQTLIQGWLK
jgi:predicted  nucleic acid-binding Zn-ribbon protein